ncbi:MAG: GHMP kinase [Nitrospinae bacterium CG11_big_fil_rev_8_21_14_0_20_56_8]|nr:MAG: GHMP kinase [Nitrospinae bacterium CG11_big_fil_rev_8_21_14_0_20_56_8]
MIQSTAPTRVDLAGGTLDIWPLFLHLGNPPTLNAAIDLYATVTLKPRRDRKIVVESRDLKLRSDFPSLDRTPTDGHPLVLILKTLKYYAPRQGVEIVTSCEAPAGSGIGGSSALNVALHGALGRWTGKALRGVRLIEVAKNIETQVIRVPTGWQDYFPALFGGVLAVVPGFEGVGFERLPVGPDELTRRFVLCYTGEPRKSAINNWQVMKDALDGKPEILRKLAAIGQVSRSLHRDLQRGRTRNLGKWLDAEWAARRTLAPNICTPQMDRLIRRARTKGALAAKVCGAGGGGCVAFCVPPQKKEAVTQELERAGARILPFRFVRRGLTVRSL